MSTVVDRPLSALELPPDRWADHPRFPHQTLLLGSHRGFRHTSRSLVARAAQGGDPVAIGWVFRAWKRAMHSHERYEEHKLYPYLSRRWGVSFDRAREGHAALAEAEAEVLAAADGDGAAAAGLTEALQRHDAILVAHLALEESLVIPALLALEPAEFETLLRTDVETLLRRMDADPPEAAPR